ncbi:MAG TPA: ABC transporter permease [Verrucomicrobiae bacterium]|nr:ABC transporter permease [Verrucomicrobiae bacterium]
MEMLATIFRDVRFALRLLAKNPAFTIVAVLTLSLGIGANTAAFSWIQNVILRSVPGVPELDRLIVIAPQHTSGAITDTMSYLDVQDLNARKDIFAGVATSQFSPVSLENGDDRLWAWGQIVSANYFDVLQVHAAMGRTFLPEEETKPGGHPVVVISDAFWKRQFAGDPQIVGKVIRLNQHAFTVVGVAPEGFLGNLGGLSFDLWAPVMMHREITPGNGAVDMFTSRGARWLHTMGRLAPGVTREQAQAACATMSKQWEKEFPNSHRDMNVKLFPLWDSPWAAPRIMLPVLSVLFAVTILVLLIVAANFANLLLARASTRAREISVRMALGGGRSRLIRQLLTESVTLASMGCALGIPAAIWLTDLLKRLFPKTYLPIALAPKLDGFGLLFMIGIALAIGILFGLAPALHASRGDLFASLKEGTRGNTTARAWLRSTLVAAQLAVALLLVIGGALCFQSFEYARRMNRGFDPNHVLLANVRLGVHGYNNETGALFYKKLAQRVREIPGVESSALAVYVPLGPEGGSSSRMSVDGYTPQAGEDMGAPFNNVTAGYFKTVSIPLLDGRDFLDSDDPSAQKVIIVNDTMAKRFWPNQNPVGRTMTIFGDRRVTVVGIVGATKLRGLNEAAKPFFYVPLQQSYTPSMNVHLRVKGDPIAFASAVREAVASIDPAVHPAILAPMKEITDFALLPFRIAAIVLAALGATALFLAVMGIYGLIAFNVSQRTTEIGIRMALGARASDVLRMILRQGLALAAIGIVVGLVGAIALTRLMSGVLLGVDAIDPVTFILASVLFIAVGLLASYLPARRAAGVNPLVALKYE